MANFNKIMLMGNLTRDPQLSYLPSQTPVVEFGLAVNRKWTSKEGEGKEEVCFIDCRAFGKPAETLNKYMKKGRQLFVEGRLAFEQWTAQDGSKRSRHRVIVENFQFLGGPGGGGAGSDSGTGSESNSDSQVEPETNGPVKGAHPPADDIPF